MRTCSGAKAMRRQTDAYGLAAFTALSLLTCLHGALTVDTAACFLEWPFGERIEHVQACCVRWPSLLGSHIPLFGCLRYAKADPPNHNSRPSNTQKGGPSCELVSSHLADTWCCEGSGYHLLASVLYASRREERVSVAYSFSCFHTCHRFGVVVFSPEGAGGGLSAWFPLGRPFLHGHPFLGGHGGALPEELQLLLRAVSTLVSAWASAFHAS